MAVKRQVVKDTYALYNGDCCEVLPDIRDESIGFSVFSPPFVSLYCYSDDPRDMSNSEDPAEFFDHFGFVIDELQRIMMPGRVVAVHCMDLPTYKRNGEDIGLYDFSGDIIREFLKRDFVFHSRHCIWKDPLIAATRTKAIGLAHKQLCKDSAMCRTGVPDYLLAFRKKGENPKPISHENGLTEYHGERSIPKTLDQFGDVEDQGKNKRSHWIWQRYASPVWDDIRQTKVLKHRASKEKDDQRHICLAKGTLVLTKRAGNIPIEDVQLGDLVLTHEGRWRPVIAKEKTADSADLVEVRAQGVLIKTTPNHKFWARRSLDKHHRKKGARNASIEWIEAKDLDSSCYLNLQVPESDASIDSLKILDDWWIVGRWIADGHFDQRDSAHLSIGRMKLDDAKKRIGHRFGFTHELDAVQVRLKDSDGRLREVLRRCGKGALHKRLPAEAFTLPSDQAKALLDGYLSGDGSFDKQRNRWSITTVSHTLAIDLQTLIQKVYGSIATIELGAPKRQDTILGRVVNCNQEYIVTFNVDATRSFGFIDDEGAWKPVKSVTACGQGETWNIRVDEDASYVAAGCVVKNCPLQLDCIERCIALWSAPGDTVLTPFLGVGSEIYVAVKNGRKGIGIELKSSYFRQAVKNVTLAANKAAESMVKE